MSFASREKAILSQWEVGPSGQFAYTTNPFSGVSAYTINATTGALTPVHFEEHDTAGRAKEAKFSGKITLPTT
jgi:hypothetical protein